MSNARRPVSNDANASHMDPSDNYAKGVRVRSGLASVSARTRALAVAPAIGRPSAAGVVAHGVRGQVVRGLAVILVGSLAADDRVAVAVAGGRANYIMLNARIS